MLFALHVTEEYLTNFIYLDRIFIFLSKPFIYIASPLIIFTVFQIILWTTMISGYFYSKERNKIKNYLLVISAITLFETHHIIEAIIAKSYYPGTGTAIFIIIIGLPLLFWRDKK